MGVLAIFCIFAAIVAVDARAATKIQGPGRMEADVGEFPSLAVILNKYTNFLITVGVLIRPRVVLTLGYNFLKESPEDIIVVVGTHNRSMDEPSRQEYNATQILIHPEFIETDETLGFGVADMSLIQLEEDVETNRRVKVFPLKNINSNPKLDNKLKDTSCISYGYGQIKMSEYERIYPRTLQKYAPKAITFKQCNDFSTDVLFPWSNRHWLCTLNKDLTTPRMGDGGNPLLCDDGSGTFVLHGLTSGSTFALSGWTYYTRLAFYRDWIVDNAKSLQA